jgi:hypothetical protein
VGTSTNGRRGFEDGCSLPGGATISMLLAGNMLRPIKFAILEIIAINIFFSNG